MAKNLSEESSSLPINISINIGVSDEQHLQHVSYELLHFVSLEENIICKLNNEDMKRQRQTDI